LAWEHWERGYSQAELNRAQERFALTFPPDLVALLRERRPKRGHDWNDEAAIRSMLAWPFEGLLFDVENDALWWPEWGQRPAEADARAEVLRSVVARAPNLIPLFAHRYLPESPSESGNPVFSVYQSDVVYYGSNLDNYFVREFEDLQAPLELPIKRIAFWSDLAERYGESPAI
jgi:hypothetical protein